MLDICLHEKVLSFTKLFFKVFGSGTYNIVSRSAKKGAWRDRMREREQNIMS